MTLALCAVSHSPLFGINDPDEGVLSEVRAAIRTMRDFAADFAPDVTIIFGPDHFNSMFYDLMPAFCIGAAAHSVGDWGTASGPLSVDRDAAHRLIKATLDAGIDMAQSERMQVDHGVAQPIEFLFGKASKHPVVPIFLNAVGLPLGPMQRVRLLGEAVGREATKWGKRVLLVGSGGLSHDPPIPRLAEASPEVAERLIAGRNPTPEAREQRQRRVIEASKAHASGDSVYREINPEFDRLVLDTLQSGQLSVADGWANEWMEEVGGHSAHEVRAWVAAFAAMSVQGAYRVNNRSYWPVKEWMTGFAVVTAVQEKL